MLIGKENNNINVEVKKKKIEQINFFKYLGVLIDREYSLEAEIV